MIRKIKFLDNTLREGEQVPGLTFSLDEKLAIFDSLCSAGVDYIDLGIPSVSKDNFEFCSLCVKRNEDVQVGATIRARRDDMDLAREAGVSSVYIMFPFSEIHIRHKFKTSLHEIKKLMDELMEYALRGNLQVNIVAEDASRGTTELVLALAKHASDHDPERIFLCDTVGTALPGKFGALTSKIIEEVRGRTSIGVHCHNDFGLATANTLAALEAGADSASVTVNGLGERAGNASLAEVALGSRYLCGLEHNIRLTELRKLSRLIEEISGVFLSFLAPITGRNAFRHESGIHIDGILKKSRVYEQLDPVSVGRHRELVLGKGTGVNFIRYLLREEGLEVSEEELRELKILIQNEEKAERKNDGIRILSLLDKYYNDNFGMPTSRFLEIAERYLKDIS